MNYNETNIAPLGFAAIILLGIAMLILPRRHAVIPMLIISCFIPVGQRIAVFSLDFTLLRIMILFGWTRILMRRETTGLRWISLDTAVVLWVISSMLAYLFFYGTMQAFIIKLGYSFDVFGGYFLFRILINDWEDFYRVLRGFIIISIPVAIFFAIEHRTGRNLFGTLGGVPEITFVRDGRLRCQGAFVHPIAAGCFWATLLPMIGALWFYGGKKRMLAATGITTSFLIVVFCASSTPVVGVMAGFGAISLFPFRHLMKLIRWGALACLVGLHFIMEAPVWALIARASMVGGSTGYHRYLLVDSTINHFEEWWLCGTNTYPNWGHATFDLANQYVHEAVRGGLMTFILFLIVLGIAFKRVGPLLRPAPRDPNRPFLGWSLGSSLFAHCVCFIGLHYSYQTLMNWLLVVAAIGSLSLVQAPAARPAETEAAAVVPARSSWQTKNT